MTSYLIDFLLVIALVVTAMRCGRLHKELRALRDTGLAEAIANAELSLNRAAEALVAMRHEGIETARDLECRVVEARGLADELSGLVADARVEPQVHVAANTGATAVHDPYRDIFAEVHDRLHASLAR
ncbi:hypothetical protein LQ948_00085 [Jiella sp. MQZ9-1]|uniref:Uncharacterized protein n=1 Tax=Jiella flava TaxID=2816857 RepID=A0A939FSX5_9HYPH|nr:hypothetical protein [Jiella flava]MBO0660957.1 hypothetical protein [Jiella flava]MCD2469605.1 hypothetical protein [Jiella flava]